MKHINKYLSSKIENIKYLTNAFPPEPVIGDILMFLENKRFKYIKSEDKTVTQLFKAIEDANCPVYTYSEYTKNSWWIRIFIGGKITDGNPMFTLQQDNINTEYTVMLYALETYSKIIKKFKTYEEFRDRINEYFKWE